MAINNPLLNVLNTNSTNPVDLLRDIKVPPQPKRFGDRFRNMTPEKKQGLSQMLYLLGGSLKGNDMSQDMATLQRNQAIRKAEADQAGWNKTVDQMALERNPDGTPKYNASQIAILKTPAGRKAYTDFDIKRQFGGGKDRRIVKGNDGYNYYADTGERVLPNVVETPDVKDSFGNQDKLRDDFRAESKEFVSVRDSYGRILAVGSKDSTPAGDLSLIFNYMKMLDPGSVVRESEFANAAASGSYGERIRAQVERVQSGERLSPAMRKDFVQQAGALYQSQLDGHSGTKNYYTNLAEDSGFKVANIVQDYTSSLAPNIFKSNIRYMSDIDLANLDFDGLTEKQQKVVKKELERRDQ